MAAGLRSYMGTLGTLMGLGDQPVLRVENLQWLLHMHQADPAKVTVPDRVRQRGNPFVIPSDFRPIMFQHPKSAGFLKFTRENLHLVNMIDTASAEFVADIDKPQDYRNLINTMNRVYHDMAF